MSSGRMSYRSKIECIIIVSLNFDCSVYRSANPVTVWTILLRNLLYYIIFSITPKRRILHCYIIILSMLKGPLCLFHRKIFFMLSGYNFIHVKGHARSLALFFKSIRTSELSDKKQIFSNFSLVRKTFIILVKFDAFYITLISSFQVLSVKL